MVVYIRGAVLGGFFWLPLPAKNGFRVKLINSRLVHH